MKGVPVGAYASLSGGFILAGSSVVAARFLAGLPVFFAAAGGAAVALLALLPLAAAEAPPDRGALRRALPLLGAQAIFGIALFRVLMLLALARTSAALAGIATSATPALTALLSAIFLREGIGPRKAAGITLAALGIAALESRGAMPAGTVSAPEAPGRLAGCLLALGAAASESVFNVLSKRLPASLGPRRASAAVMALALLILGGLSLASGETVDPSALGLAPRLAFAYMGIFASALAYTLWFAGVARVPASTAGAFAGLMPVSSFALSIAVLGERPRAAAFIGSAIAIAGILLCATSPRKPSATARLEETA